MDVDVKGTYETIPISDMFKDQIPYLSDWAQWYVYLANSCNILLTIYDRRIQEHCARGRYNHSIINLSRANPLEP